MPCIVCMIALYLLCSPPLLSPVDPAATADYTAAEHDYFTDDRTPTIELPGKQSHSPLPHIAYLSIFICCTRHMLLLRYFPIQMHSLSLSPLVVPFLYPMQPIINIIYSSEPCALLANRIR